MENQNQQQDILYCEKILKELIELNNLIDSKCILIQEQNFKNNFRIDQYKILMENIILDYHNVCKKIFIN